MKIGVAKERAPNERRVALAPDVLPKLTAAGAEMLVERGAGDAAAIPDAAYEAAGAKIVSQDELLAQADVVLTVQRPQPAEMGKLRKGQAVIGLLQPLLDAKAMESLAEQGVMAISLDALPRTLSRAQSMDALSSQANVGGYRAVLVAARGVRPLLPAADHRRRHGQTRPTCWSSASAWPDCRQSPPPAGLARWSRPTTSAPRRRSRPSRWVRSSWS